MSLGICQTERRKLVRRGLLGFARGLELRAAEWVTEACGVPLFSGDGAVCRGCACGWWHPRNYPAALESEMQQPCPALAMPAPADAEREYEGLYLEYYGAGRKGAA